MKTLVLGLGNPLLKDDGVGLRVAEALEPRLAARPDLEVGVDYHGGLRLMERMIGFDRAVIIDAIRTGAAAGTLHRLGPHGIATQHSASTHDVNLPTALRLGREAGARLPPDNAITLIGVEVVDVLTFGETLTPQVEAAIPAAAEAVLAELRSGGFEL